MITFILGVLVGLAIQLRQQPINVNVNNESTWSDWDDDDDDEFDTDDEENDPSPYGMVKTPHQN